MHRTRFFLIFFLLTLICLSFIFISCEETGDGDDDTTPPVISQSYPADGATDVPVNLQFIAIGFNEFMAGGSSHNADGPGINFASGPPEWYTYDEDDDYDRFSIMIIGLSGNLNPNETYTITLNASSSDMYYEDLAGNKLAADTTITFVTGTGFAPTITNSTPADNAVNVSKELPEVVLTFSESMTGNNSFHPGVPWLSASWENSNQERHYVVDVPLDSNREYKVVVNPFGHDFNVQSSATGLPVDPYTIIHFTTEN